MGGSSFLARGVAYSGHQLLLKQSQPQPPQPSLAPSIFSYTSLNQSAPTPTGLSTQTLPHDFSAVTSAVRERVRFSRQEERDEREEQRLEVQEEMIEMQEEENSLLEREIAFLRRLERREDGLNERTDDVQLGGKEDHWVVKVRAILIQSIATGLSRNFSPSDADTLPPPKNPNLRLPPLPPTRYLQSHHPIHAPSPAR